MCISKIISKISILNPVKSPNPTLSTFGIATPSHNLRHEHLSQIIPQMPASGGMAQFAQCFGLDLADALAGHVEVAADFLQRVVFSVGQPKRSSSTWHSRSERAASACCICSRSISREAASNGSRASTSSMKSPNWEASSSPTTGPSSENGSSENCRTRSTLAVARSRRCLSSGSSYASSARARRMACKSSRGRNPDSSASSSTVVGSRPNCWTSVR